MKSIVFKSMPAFSGIVYDLLQGEIMKAEVRTLTDVCFSIDVPDDADEAGCRSEAEQLLARVGLYCGQHYNFI